MIEREPIDTTMVQEGKVLEVEQQLQLIAPITEKDIKEAIFSIHPMKSPGPDSHNSSFFRETWSHGRLGLKYAELFKNFSARARWISPGMQQSWTSSPKLSIQYQ